MEYKTKVKVETDNIKVSLAKDEFNMNGIVDSNVANVGVTTTDTGLQGGANPVTITNNFQPYGGMVVNYLPSVGGLNGAKRFQLAFKDQFVKVVGSSYSALTLNECDLIKLAIYSEGLYLFISEIDRAIHTYDKFDKVNRAFGKFLVELMGFSWADLAQNRQRWIDERNVLAHIVNEKFYLGKSARLTRHITLASKVYAADTSRKTQVIVFNPMEYVDIYSLTSWEIGLAGFTVPGQHTVNKAITLSSLTTLVNNVRDASMSAWYDDVAPYLHHLYGDGDTDLYKIEDYKDCTDFAIVYDSNILTMIKNMRLLQGVYQEAARSTLDQKIWITEDTAGYIRQGGWASGAYTNAAEFMLGAKDSIWSPGGQNISLELYYSKEYNVEDYPVKDDQLFSAMLGRFTQILANAGAGVPGVIHETTTTLFYSCAIAWSNSDAEGSVTSYQDMFNIYVDTSASGYQQTARCRDLSVPSRNDLFNELMHLGDFAVYPYAILLYGSVNSPSVIPHFCDIDNQFNVDIEVWRQFITAEVYESTKFKVPEFKARK